MSTTCTAEIVAPRGPAPTQAPVETLRAIVREYGTPAYAYDLRRVRAQADKLRANLPDSVEILYSLKANASLGLCGVLARCGLGADVASAGEIVTALAAGFAPDRLLVTGPDKSLAVLEQLRTLPEAIVSLDSVSELELLAAAGQPQRVLLRLRPDFASFATCSAGPGSRFGLTFDDLQRCRSFLHSTPLRVVGFHVFSGSQVLAPDGVNHHLRSGLDEALRAAQVLRIRPEIIDIGGGFGTPYGPDDQELDLAPIAAELQTLVQRAAPARLVIELGRYFVAQAGWYLTSVLARQTHGGRSAVVVDGGSHHRVDMCGIGLRNKAYAPVALDAGSPRQTPTDVLGCLSLPADVLIEAALLPSLSPGDVLAFPNAGAYGLGAAPMHFHGHAAPAEVAFDGTRIEPLRLRQPVHAILDGQILPPSPV
jgi:diaminopimelate decarboxylase